MSKSSSTAINVAHSGSPERVIQSEELIKRMAEDLRAKSGSDLPLSCFVEQVKMQLSSRPLSANGNVVPSLAANKSTADASALFKAWAMPE
jgi:hypothetical protein